MGVIDQIGPGSQVLEADGTRSTQVRVVGGSATQPTTPVTAIDSAVDPAFLPVTISATVTRPGDTSAYATNDCWSTSTSAPTVGGNVLTGAARVSGGAGEIVDVMIDSSNDPAAPLQGELWIYDTTVTAINDNAAFAPAVADRLKQVAVIPFTLYSNAGGSGSSGSSAHVLGVNALFTTVGSANLIFLIKVKNAYVPANAEVLQVRAKIRQLN